MIIEQLSADDIKPYETNPRQIGDDAIEAVASSIKMYGWQQPIVVDENNKIVAGHVRYLAARKIGLDTIPVKRADDLSEAEVRQYRILDNKVSELAKWDSTLLEFELSEIEADLSSYFEDDDFEGSRAYAFLDNVAAQDASGTMAGMSVSGSNENVEGSLDTETQYVTLSFSLSPDDRDLVMGKLKEFARDLGLNGVNQALVEYVRSRSNG